MFGFGKKNKIVPERIQYHRKHECVRIGSPTYHQDVLTSVPEGTLEVKIVDCPHDYADYSVLTMDDVKIGSLSVIAVERAGINPPCTATVEVVHPHYKFETDVMLYLPRTPEAIAHEEEMRKITVQMKVNGDKWLGPKTPEGVDFTSNDVELVTVPPKGKGKPTLEVWANGRKCFVVTPRMGVYAQLVENSEHPIRSILAYRKSGKYGPFYKVTLKYCI